MRFSGRKWSMAVLLATLSLLAMTVPVSAADLLPSLGGEGGFSLAERFPLLGTYLEGGNLGTGLSPTLYPLIYAAAPIGLLLAFFGYPLLKLTVFLGGFGTGIFVANLLLANERIAAALTSPWMPFVFMLILGAICAWLFCKLFSLALFFTTFGAVLFVGIPFVTERGENLLVGIAIVGVAAIVLGSLSTRFVRPIAVLVTAATGGYLFAMALSGLIPVPHIKLVLSLPVFILGLAVQLRAKTPPPHLQ